ncbi:MAG TPA: secretin N-terminal domain-containing protein [Acidobacteriaceae bacterium]|nr:secretin N-terminal domain-containing protein [Acidobacteriaceae bacterium]
MKRSLLIRALFVAFFAAIFFSVPAAHAQSASHLFKEGQAAENAGDTLTAYQDYYQAFQKKPNDERYKLAWERTRFSAAAEQVERGERLRDQGDYTGALTDFLRALEIDPSNELATEDIQATKEKLNAQNPQGPQTPRTSDEAFEDLAPPVQLKPLGNERMTLHMVEDSRVVYQAVGKMAGINVLFDPQYASKRIQVDLQNVDLYDALRIVATVSGTFWRPVTSNTIFVAEDTPSKHRELDQQAVETFYLHNVAQQNDFTEMQTVLRNLFQTARINGVSSENAIVMRGTPDEILLARRLIADLDKARPEVVIDVAVLEVSRDLLRNIGIQLPQTASINFQPSNYDLNNESGTSSTSTTTSETSTTTTSLTLNNLAHLNSTNFAVTIGQAAVDLLLTDTRSRIIQNPEIRASDGQEATLKIGERIPIATGSYAAPGLAAGAAIGYAQTQFQYIDVGVDMTIKPTVHFDRDVTLKSKIEVSATNGSSNIEGVNEPIITQRVVDHTVRLKDGEANLLGGILQHQTTYTISGTPGLGELPLIKYLFSTQEKETTDDEIVFLLIPHVVRAEQISPEDVQEIDTGTGNNFQVHELTSTQQVADSMNGQSQAVLPAFRNSAAAQATQPATGSNAAQAAQQAMDTMQQEANAGPPVSLQLTPEQSVQKAGTTFQVAVNVSGGKDVFSVPLQVQYDASKLSLINADLPDPRNPNFLGKDGQAITLVHRDDGNGNVSVVASRPPGVKGVSGSGTLCVLTFQAKAPGSASVAITRPVVRNSQQQVLPATGSQAIVLIK